MFWLCSSLCVISDSVMWGFGTFFAFKREFNKKEIESWGRFSASPLEWDRGRASTISWTGVYFDNKGLVLDPISYFILLIWLFKNRYRGEKEQKGFVFRLWKK